MEKLKIRGARRLVGEVRVSGAKNAALPILAASLLTAGDLELKNVPDLADVRTMLKLLAGMGVKVERSGSNVTLNAGAIASTEAPYDLVKTMQCFDPHTLPAHGPLRCCSGESSGRLRHRCASG